MEGAGHPAPLVVGWFAFSAFVDFDSSKEIKKELDLDKDCTEAIDQIVTEKYGEGLYGYTQVLCYGVAFFQKQAKVKKLVTG